MQWAKSRYVGMQDMEGFPSMNITNSYQIPSYLIYRHTSNIRLALVGYKIVVP